MLEGFFGEEAFRAGAQAFLRTHQFASATTADFSAALEKSTGRQAAKIVAGWVDQSGFPLIRATTQCIGGKRVVSLEQVRFSIGARDENPGQWSIPIGIFSNLSPGNVKYALLEKLSSNFDFPVCDGAIKANAGGLGFFRVLYEPAQFNDLQSSLLGLPEEDRINLLADTWAFVEAGNLEASAYFGVLDNLIQDDSLGLWKTALGTGPVPGALKVIDRLEQGQPGRENYQKYVCGIFRPKLRALGWEEKSDEDAETRQFRALVIETLGFFGDRDVIDEAFKRFESYRQNPASLSPDLRAPVLLVVARYSSESTYEQLLAMVPGAPTFEEKQLLLRALSGTLEPALTKRTLLYLLSGSETPALVAQTFESLSEQGEHPEIAWEFLKSHAEELQKRLGAYRFNELMLRSASRFSDESHAADVSDFIQNHLPSESKPFAERASESIRFREKLKTRELPVIDKWIGLKAGT